MATTSMMTSSQNGKKLSFADWIAQISPEDTLFSSAIGKESIDQITFKWQTDVLDPVAPNAQLEGSDAGDFTGVATFEIDNQTQIFRKVVRVSDTANNTANYGRGRELQYQMVKAGASLKRDIEAAMLGNGAKGTVSTGSANAVVGAKMMGGVRGLVGETGTSTTAHGTVNQSGHTGTKADIDTGAVVVKPAALGTVTGTASATNPLRISQTDNSAFEKAIMDMSQELYKANSKANIIMAHPSMAEAFSEMLERGTGEANRVRYFENSKVLDLEVNQLVTPLGQKFKLVFNRFMPVSADGSHYVFFFNTADWDQMVYRAPAVTNLAKLGSAESKMIETEISLRHRHPYASAILNIAVKP